ncbi:50S ribosomal protein L11 methyltransferase [Seleniivibrio woodruffii]|uniref:Ribosomal protein L11 methyltransferase n=1 Tax=Seleniivibrio woodruffii TaxID=1078050 RepID=A0A4R1K991_9BACT|nr:50S ribosomal protein L11 methyltransferase [Seleniivibrio woodruffii]TCK60942.1 ribosomal protein L11 methyltransferase [Seleniivibrio woodruffii]TVZ36572.1 [LSU ribosomal protein L11P]-lysine N-methyltransferase [Seleniivibrio woodruffii]
MYEYRFKQLSEESVTILEDMGIYPIEEDFKGQELCFVVYFGDGLEDIIKDEWYQKVEVEETGWDTKWKEFIKPGNLTDSLKYVFDLDAVSDSGTIIINPAMAFGTGTHATTRCAARLLEDVVSGKNVADVGCGSGILAIAAAKRGAKDVYAFDIDPEALDNTLENIERNHVNVKAWTGDIDSLTEKVDVIVANIITSVLKVIHPPVLEMKPEYIVYSGILAEEYEEFMKEIDIKDYDIVRTVNEAEWCGVLLKCRSQQ